MGHILTPKVLKRQVSLVAKENREFVASQESRKNQIEKRIKKLEQEIGNIMSAIAEYGPTNPAYGREIERRQEEQELLQRESGMISSELQDKLAFVNEPSRIVENALSLRTYLDIENQHSLKQMLNSLISKVTILDSVATLNYTLPLPRNGTEEPIFKEIFGLDKYTCPSGGSTGMRLRSRTALPKWLRGRAWALHYSGKPVLRP